MALAVAVVPPEMTGLASPMEAREDWGLAPVVMTVGAVSGTGTVPAERHAMGWMAQVRALVAAFGISRAAISTKTEATGSSLSGM